MISAVSAVTWAADGLFSRACGRSLAAGFAAAVGAIKARSSIALKKEFPFISRMYLGGNVWSVGYYSSTNGLNEEAIRRYIERQGRRDYSADAQKELGFS